MGHWRRGYGCVFVRMYPLGLLVTPLPLLQHAVYGTDCLLCD